MGTVVVMSEPGRLVLEEYPERPLAAGEVRLAMLYSGISAGTQLTLYRGVNPYDTKEWNAELRLFQAASPGHTIYPVKGCWGYEEAGRVVELGAGVDASIDGAVVYGTWGHRSTQVVSAAYAAAHRLPDGLDPVVGIYSQMGSIALNAILDADIHVGETVAVFGQGVPGQLVTRLAVLNGATVIAVDAMQERLVRARAGGASMALQAGTVDAAREIKLATEHRGADIAIEISGSSRALHEAIRSTAYNGKVVCSGFIQGGADGLRLGEEFHHNRVVIICSQIQAVSPSAAPRWNRERMERTIFELARGGSLDLAGLVTHRIPFHEAAGAYRMLDTRPSECMQVVLTFPAP